MQAYELEYDGLFWMRRNGFNWILCHDTLRRFVDIPKYPRQGERMTMKLSKVRPRHNEWHKVRLGGERLVVLKDNGRKSRLDAFISLRGIIKRFKKKHDIADQEYIYAWIEV